MIKRLVFAAALMLPLAARAQTPQSLTLPTDLVVALGDYLKTKPYVEVAGLLGAMQRAVDPQLQAGQHHPAPKPTEKKD
jgi:hypothetical protein